MSDLVHLQQGEWMATVDPHGAWLTTLQRAGQDILFPQTELRQPDGGSKVRGGAHVCYPNFGPGGVSGLAQHGFGRTSDWTVMNSGPELVELLLVTTEAGYADVDTRLTYQLSVGGLIATLELHNTGTTPIPIAPGFHPYFAPDALGRAITLSAENLSVFTIWTDQPSTYICVEPTMAGNAFIDMTPNRHPLQLEPNASWQAGFKISPL